MERKVDIVRTGIRIVVISFLLAQLFSIGIPAPSLCASTAVNIAGIERSFLNGDYAKVLSDTRGAIDERRSTNDGKRLDDLYYMKALAEIKLNKYSEARGTFSTLLEKCQSSRRAFDAAVGIGDTFFLSGDAPRALTAYNEAINRYSDTKNVATAYYRIGNCYKKMGLHDKAAEYERRAKRDAPLGFEAKAVADEAGYSAPKASQSAEGSGSGSGDYSVQAGYFKSKKNASGLASNLKAQGFDSAVSQSGDFYRVTVGRYQTKRDASTQAAKLKRLGFSTKICSGDVCSFE